MPSPFISQNKWLWFLKRMLNEIRSAAPDISTHPSEHIPKKKEEESGNQDQYDTGPQTNAQRL
jgi:hypothetical protein